jgi:hypothetical protein
MAQRLVELESLIHSKVVASIVFLKNSGSHRRNKWDVAIILSHPNGSGCSEKRYVPYDTS